MNRLVKTALIAPSLCIAMPHIALAQTALPLSAVEPGPPAPTDRFETITKGVVGGLDISEKKAEAKISLGGNLTTTVTAADGSGAQTQDAFFWKLGAELPIGGTSDLTDDASLDLLDSGVKFTAGLTWMHSKSDLLSQPQDVFLPYVNAAVEACERKNPDQDCSVIRRIRPDAAVRDHLPQVHALLARNPYDAFWTVGIRGSIGIREFDYTTQGIFTDFSPTEESYSVAFTGVYYPSDRVSAWKLEAEYSDGYKAAEETIVCKTIVTDPAKDCKKASPVAPTQTEALVIRGEYRRSQIFGTGDKGIGFAIAGNVDTLSGDLGLEVPLFFSLGKTSPILPGVKFGYKKDTSKANDEDESFTVAIFLKTSFGF